MKICIHTIHNNEEVQSIAEEKNIKISHINTYGKLNIYEIYFTDNTIDFLVSLLESTAISKNPIVTNKNVKDSIVESVFIPLREKVAKELREYLNCHNIINIEGYFTFRMEDHKIMMYSMIYSIIRKHFRFS